MYATTPTSTTWLQRHQLLGYIGSTSTLLCVATTPCAAAWLVVRSHCLYFKYTVRCDYSLPAASALRQLCRSSRLLVCRLQRLYLNHVARPDASARRAARRRLLRPRHASGCLSTSRGSSRGPSSTTLPTPRVRVPRHVTRLVVDYFAHATRPGASARHATRHAARRRLLRLCRAFGCLSTSRASSSTTRRLAARLLVGRLYWFSPCARSLRLAAQLLCAPPLDFSHAVHRDYLSCSNTGSTSSTPRAAMTSSSGRIASTTHLD
jgi:hypothetical protein